MAGKKKKIMGRPKIDIDWDEFKKLCQMQATLVEISGWFDCSEDTIERRVQEEYGITFAEHFKKTSSGGKASLRRMQFQSAEKGNVTMQIWLGKQHLDQKDKSDVTVSTPDDRQFNLNFTSKPITKTNKENDNG